jgi:hypothetical protein
MQNRYAMTSMLWGNLSKGGNICPTPFMPGNVTSGWRLLQTTVTIAEHKQNLFLFTWTWERL